MNRFRKSTFEHRTTKIRPLNAKLSEKISERHFFCFVIIPFAPEPSITACADPTLCEVISFQGQGQLCQLTEKRATIQLQELKMVSTLPICCCWGYWSRCWLNCRGSNWNLNQHILKLKLHKLYIAGYSEVFNNKRATLLPCKAKVGLEGLVS